MHPGYDPRSDPGFVQRAGYPQYGYPTYPAPPAPGQQVTKARRETRHGLHLVLTICTFGLWAFTGWPVAWAWNRFGPRAKTVTRWN